jgi:AcrR family transcriptional regulator
MSKAKSASLTPKTLGRPKSRRSHEAILTAARDILDELGSTRLTIDGVAKRAGVGKPTIYRSWANAQELGMAALAGPLEGIRAPTQMVDLVRDVIVRLNTKRGRQMALLLASAEPDGELFKAFANQVILKGRQAGLEILTRQRDDGLIHKDVDLPLVLDMIFGAIMIRLLLRHEPLSEGDAAKVVDLAMSGIKK